MSWDRIEYQEAASCACGKGRVIRTAYQEDDDWNRFRSGSFGEEIECSDCSKKYHIEHLVRHFFQYSWDGDGISDTTYLVENGYTLKHKTSVDSIPVNGVEENIVASFTKDELMQALAEMKSAKFSTKLQLQSSKQIVSLYFKRYKKRSLPRIIEYLQICIDKYESFQWNPDTIKQYHEREKQLAAKGKQKLDEALLHAVKVEWKRA